MSAQRAKVRSCTVTARVLSPDEARARRTCWVAAAWGLVWAFATLPVVRAGLAGGGRGALGAACAVVSCVSLFISCSSSLRRVRRGEVWPGRLNRAMLAVGAITAVGAIVGVGAQGLQLVVFLTIALAAEPDRKSVV